MADNKISQSASSLLQMYSTVMGIAFAFAARSLFENPSLNGSGFIYPSVSAISLFIAYTTTFVPFYHGCVVLFQDTYIDCACEKAHLCAIALDFILMFIHAIGFMALGTAIRSPSIYFYILVSLFSVDVAWCVLANISSISSKRQRKASKAWGLINFFIVCFGSLIFIWFGKELSSDASPDKIAMTIAFMCTLRTVLDYYFAFDMYFGHDAANPHEAACSSQK